MELFTPYYILADIMLSWGLEPRYCVLINMTIALHNSRHWIRMLTAFYYRPARARAKSLLTTVLPCSGTMFLSSSEAICAEKQNSNVP